MKIPNYISPSACNKFYADRESYYLEYLADTRAPRTAQTPPMAIGGCFDSHVTRALAIRLFGSDDVRCCAGGEFDLSVMLEGAIQIPDITSLEYAKLRDAGKALFMRYMETGAYGRLCSELDGASDVHMQGALYYNVPGVSGLQLMGKPDLAFTLSSPSGMVQHVYDFKVNGFYSSASPLKNHTWKAPGLVPHKAAQLSVHPCGTTYDVSGYFQPQYLRQTLTYAWALLGQSPNKSKDASLRSPAIVGIEQLACRAPSSRWKDNVVMDAGDRQVAVSTVSCRALVSPEVQDAMLAEYVWMWERIQSGWIFDHLSRAESDELCSSLERRAQVFADAGDMSALYGR